MLTDAKIKGATARDKAYRLADSHQPYLFVTTAGSRLWRMDYHHERKRRTLALGSYPLVTLSEARAKRADAERVMRDGREPGFETKRARVSQEVGHENRFEQCAREWHSSQVPRWRPVHASDVITAMAQGFFPEIGGVPVDQIDEGLLLHALRRVDAPGARSRRHTACGSAGNGCSATPPAPAWRIPIQR